MFSLHFTIYPLLMKKLGMVKARIVLAPRGMLRASALAHKPGKKKIYMNMFRFMGLPKEILFHATDQTEEQDIRSIFGPGSSLFRAGNLPGKQKPFRPPGEKRKGNLRLVFVGRIHPIKNLDFLLLALQGVTGTVELTVIATLEDETYWKHCQTIMNAFPPGISVQMLVDLPHDRIEENILAAHAFALPTKGENFGHSIFESLAAGRPVLISDQTPWRNLPGDHAGWDLPLGDPAPFRRVIQELVDMDAPALETWCLGAWIKAKDYLTNTSTRSAILKVFAEINTMP
jgi:glycosyltransferase involved in cell wall biosynthesis